MTQERLEALQKLNDFISYTENVITDEDDDYLRALIVKYYEDRLTKLRKEFEEA